MDLVTSDDRQPGGSGRGSAPKPRLLRFSQLSALRQALVRLCQTINYGYIQGLEVTDSDPVFIPPPMVLVDVKLDADQATRPEVDLTDFVLRDEILRLMAQLDEIQNGVIEKIEVRAGIPRRLVLSCPPSGVPMSGTSG